MFVYFALIMMGVVYFNGEALVDEGIMEPCDVPWGHSECLEKEEE